MIAIHLAPLRFVALELAVAAAFTLTLLHARRDSWRLFQWLVGFAYGVMLELIAFAFFDNYHHGQFTLQLDHGKLPLYVTFVYPAFHYTALQLIQRWRLTWLAEALLCGLFLVLIDAPFDTAGPDAGWWIWSTKDPNLAVRWLGVPVNSYYWYLLFGALYAAILRASRPRLERRRPMVRLMFVPLLALAVIVTGMIAFIPFHLLKAAGVPDSLIVGVHLAGCAVLALIVWPRAGEPAARELRLSAALLQLCPILILVTLSPLSPIKIAVSILAFVLLSASCFARPRSTFGG